MLLYIYIYIHASMYMHVYIYRLAGDGTESGLRESLRLLVAGQFMVWFFAVFVLQLALLLI